MIGSHSSFYTRCLVIIFLELVVLIDEVVSILRKLIGGLDSRGWGAVILYCLLALIRYASPICRLSCTFRSWFLMTVEVTWTWYWVYAVGFQRRSLRLMGEEWWEELSIVFRCFVHTEERSGFSTSGCLRRDVTFIVGVIDRSLVEAGAARDVAMVSCKAWTRWMDPGNLEKWMIDARWLTASP